MMWKLQERTLFFCKVKCCLSVQMTDFEKLCRKTMKNQPVDIESEHCMYVFVDLNCLIYWSD